MALNLWSGTEHTWRYELHKKYGPIVRIGPKSLSFTDPRAWRDIHGFSKGVPLKDPEVYQPAPNNIRNLFAEPDDEKHRFQRKIFTHAFSDRALKEQEPLFSKYIDVLVERIERTVEADPQSPFDIVKLLNFTTFDIMGDLCFGESLGLLQSADYSPWVSMLLGAFKMGARIRAITLFEPFYTLFTVWKPEKIEKMRQDHFQFSVERVNKRLKTGIERPDIWGLVLANQEKGQGLSLGAMHSNAGLFMGAGTETTATELSGLLYYLLGNPACMKRLVDEITSEFATEDDITMERIAKLPYLHACIEEGLRIFPPIPGALPRVVPKGGSIICGHMIPEGIRVSIPQYASYHLHFADPFSFHPERFLPDAPAVFAHDDKSAHQPFSHGPRNCLGKNMAYHEIRLVLVTLLFHFEFELADGMQGWAERQRSYAIWEKGPLLVTARVRA
jgi:cytochrome P450